MSVAKKFLEGKEMETEEAVQNFFSIRRECLIKEKERSEKQLLAVEKRMQKEPRSLFSTAWHLWVRLPILIPKKAHLFNEVEEIEGDLCELQFAEDELEKGEREKAVAILKAIIKRTPPILSCGFYEGGFLGLPNPLFWKLNCLQHELASLQ